MLHASTLLYAPACMHVCFSLLIDRVCGRCRASRKRPRSRICPPPWWEHCPLPHSTVNCQSTIPLSFPPSFPRLPLSAYCQYFSCLSTFTSYDSLLPSNNCTNTHIRWHWGWCGWRRGTRGCRPMYSVEGISNMGKRTTTEYVCHEREGSMVEERGWDEPLHVTINENFQWQPPAAQTGSIQIIWLS